MSSRHVRYALSFIISILVSFSLTQWYDQAHTAAPVVQAAKATGHPNVVLFMLDDANVEDIKYMPAVQNRLVDRGVTFKSNYSPLPLCCPARASILTGQYPHNTKVVDNIAPLGGAKAFDDSSTIATWLNADYRTAFIGKYLNEYGEQPGGHTYIPPGWNTWKVPPTKFTYEYMGQHLNMNGKMQNFEGIYSTTLYGNQSKAFLGGPGTDPFLLITSFVAPHTGYPHEPGDPILHSPNVQRKYRNTYAGPRFPRDTSFNEKDISDKRFSFQKKPFISPNKRAAIHEVLAQRRESLKSADDQIASIMKKVKSIGEGSNTYYILMSDNGFYQGQHRIPSGKGQPYEADARVPLIIRGPGLPAGTTVNALSGVQDIPSTILSMTNEWGSQNGAQLDGMQLLQLANGGTSPRAMLLETAVTDDIDDLVAARGNVFSTKTTLNWKTRSIITSGGWKLINYLTTNEVELYNLNNDPFEKQNLGRNPAWDTKQAELAAKLATLKNCDGMECR